MNSDQYIAFALAEFFYPRLQSASMVVVTKKPEGLIGQLPKDIKLFVVCRPSKLAAQKQKLQAHFSQVQCITNKELNESFLEHKIFVNFGGLGGSWLGGHKTLNKALNWAALSIATGRAAKKSSSDQLVFRGKSKLRVGSEKNSQAIKLGGRLVNIKARKFPLLPVLAIMHVYNEQDIIAATINHLLSQGVDVHIIDNWSEDGTYEIVQKLANDTGRVTFERFPAKNNKKFELAKMLTRVTDVAKSKKQYKWAMLNDADEIRWSPWPGVSLQEGFSFIDSLSYNAVDYTVFNFSPTKEGFDANHNPKTFFEYGEFGTISGYFTQVKAWQNHPKATMAPSGGHKIGLPNLKIFPLKFFLSHYPMRSTKHAQEKIFKQRKPRYAASEKKRGWHTHYNSLKKSDDFIRGRKGLVKFDQKDFYKSYITERISGVGIKRDPED